MGVSPLLLTADNFLQCRLLLFALLGFLTCQRVHEGRVNKTCFRPAGFRGDGQQAPLLASVGDDGALVVTTMGEDPHHSR